MSLLTLSLGLMGCPPEPEPEPEPEVEVEEEKVIAAEYRGVYTGIYPTWNTNTVELKEKSIIYTGVERKAWTENDNGIIILKFEYNNDFGYNWRFDEDGDLNAAPKIGGDVLTFRK